MRFWLPAAVSLVAGPGWAAEPPASPIVVRFAPGAATLDESSTRKVEDAAGAVKASGDRKVYFCLVDERAAQAEDRMEALLDRFASYDLTSDQVWEDYGCRPGLTAGSDQPAHPDGAILLIGSERAIDSMRDEAVLAYSNYVPDRGWGDDWGVFYEDWFGRHLMAMDEPTFEGVGAADEFEQRFRMAVFPNSMPAYAIRIDQSATGKHELHWTLLDGRGGYDEGQVLTSGKRALSAKEARRFELLLARAALTARPMKEPEAMSDDGSFPICIHGTHWVFETVTRRSRAFIERGFCDYADPALDELTRFARKLAGRRLSAAQDGVSRMRFGD